MQPLHATVQNLRVALRARLRRRLTSLTAVVRHMDVMHLPDPVQLATPVFILLVVAEMIYARLDGSRSL